MNDTLMELIDGAQVMSPVPSSTDDNIAKAAEFEALGFRMLADQIMRVSTERDKLSRLSQYDYLRITEESISKFLAKKVELYDRERRYDPKDAELDRIRGQRHSFGEMFSRMVTMDPS